MDTSHGNPMASLLVGELRTLLISGGFVHGVNLRVAELDGSTLIHMMAVQTGSLGLLLAALTDPAELDDPASLSCRITPGDGRDRPDLWRYDLVASRYPGDHAIAFSAKVTLPTSDLPEVVRRLRRSQ